MGRRVLTTDPDVTEANVAKLTPTQQEMCRVGVAEVLKTEIADGLSRPAGYRSQPQPVARGDPSAMILSVLLRAAPHEFVEGWDEVASADAAGAACCGPIVSTKYRTTT
jgi:hypothetical protein